MISALTKYLFKARSWLKMILPLLWRGLGRGLLLLIYSCAQVVSPSGGPKDTNPPKAIKYIPDSATVNFKSREISIYFDEFVQMNNPSQLVISPPLDKMPEIKIKNKEVHIEFEGPLEDSTTYSINFGNAITDITENNAAENFSYIFSTGTFIDSIALTGKVDYAFDHKTEKEVLIMLYSNIDDSVPNKKVPNYFAKTKENGSFKISNIKSGKYKVFALKDANANYLFDTPEENIGFIDTLLDLQKRSKVDFTLFKELPKKQFLRKATAIEYGHVMFVFNKPIEGLNVTPLNFTAKKEWYLEEYSTNKDTVHYWLTGVNAMDTLELQVSDYKGILDTVEIKTLSKENKGGRGSKFEFSVKTNLQNKAMDLNGKLLMTFNHPINKYDFSKVIFTVDSIKQTSNGGFSNKLNLKNLSIRPDSTVSKTWKENANYNIFIPPGTFMDMFDLTNDTIKLEFKTPEIKEYGTLKLKVDIPKTNTNYILQLLNDKGNVVRENMLDSTATINYEYLAATTYTLKLIYDANKNGKWDTGDYFKKIQPEKTTYFSTPVEIRANWDIEQGWKVE